MVIEISMLPAVNGNQLGKGDFGAESFLPPRRLFYFTTTIMSESLVPETRVLAVASHVSVSLSVHSQV